MICHFFFAKYAKRVESFIISVMEVTLQDIARELDISQATVSRSLRHDTLINPETRARVNEAAQRMGYKTRVRRPRRPVEQVTTSRMIGLLLRHNSLDTMRHDMNLMKMMSGIMSVTDSHRIQLQIHSIHHGKHRAMSEDASAVPPMVEEGLCQAFILHGDQDERDIQFLSERAPVVSMGRAYRTLPVDAVVGDNVDGMRAVVTHLAELGHRRLAWVGARTNATFMQARQAGWIQGCIEHGLEANPCFSYGPEIYDEANAQALNGILAALETGVTGFACGNDTLAQRMVEILNHVGRRVPDDISVTGFDNALNERMEQRLTSVDPHFFEIGQTTAQRAIQRMTQSLSHSCVISVRGELVRGETSAAPSDLNPKRV